MPVWVCIIRNNYSGHETVDGYTMTKKGARKWLFSEAARHQMKRNKFIDNGMELTIAEEDMTVMARSIQHLGD